MGLFAACGNNDDNLEEELPMLDVDFDVPESGDAGDNIHLEAFVTYDEKPVEEADEVLFEIWEKGDQDNGEKIEAENEGEGIYTLDYDFDDDGIYEMYAHTTAEGLHTMPKEQIVIGDAEESDYEDEEEDENNNNDANM